MPIPERGYKLPDDIDAPRTRCVFLCLPDDGAYIRAFFGQLFELTRWHAWERDNEKQGTLAGQAWMDVYTDAWECYTMSGSDCQFSVPAVEELLRKLLQCCEDSGPSAQINIYNYRWTVINQYSGDPPSINPDSPDDAFDMDVDDTPEIAAKRAPALCYAIEQYIDTIVDQTRDRYMAATGLVVSGLALLLSPMAAVITLIAGAALLDLESDIFNDEEARQKVRCCMFDGLTGEAVTHANFMASVQSCGFLAGSHEAQLASIIHAANQDEANFLVFVDHVGRALLAADVIDFGMADCTCQTDRFEWDWDDQTLQDWQIAEGTPYMTAYPANIHTAFTSQWSGADYRITGPGDWNEPDTYLGAYYRWNQEYNLSSFTYSSAGNPHRARLAFFDSDDNLVHSETYQIVTTQHNRTFTFSPPIEGIRTVSIECWEVNYSHGYRWMGCSVV